MNHKTKESLISCFSFGLIIPVGLGLFLLACWVNDVAYFHAVLPSISLEGLLAENFVLGFMAGLSFIITAAFTSQILRTYCEVRNYEEKKR